MKLNDELKSEISRLDRNKLEFFLVSLLHYKLNKFTKKSYSTEELRLIMSSLPHFDKPDQFMMLTNYDQSQIFKAYKQVFLALINELNVQTVGQLKQLIITYIESSDDSDLCIYSSFLDAKNLAA